MGIYERFSYDQLNIVLSQNPNDVEAKKRLDLIEKRSLNSSDFFYYFGGILIVCSLFIFQFKVFGFFEIMNEKIILFYSLFGSLLFLLNVDNYMIKRKLKNKT